MKIRLLGPVEVWADGRSVDVGPSRQRGVLAALAVDAGRPVLLDTVIDRVWGKDPPQRARHALYVYVSHIRRILEQAETQGNNARLVRHAGAYLLDIDPVDVDAHRFRALAEQASHREILDAQRVAILREALSLWHGTPLGDMPGAWAAQVREAWQRQRIDMAVSWAWAEIRLGHSLRIIDPLCELIAERPQAEHLAAVLLWALHSAGRRAEALDYYAATRRWLADELGMDPGDELQAIFQAIVRGERESPANVLGNKR